MFAILAQSILTNDDATVAYERKTTIVNTWVEVTDALRKYAETAKALSLSVGTLSGYEFYIQKQGTDSVLFRTVAFENGRPNFQQSFYTK